MALIPSNIPSDGNKREASQQDALLREVDDAYRQDQFADLAKRYGKPVVTLVIVGLAAFGGWLWWNDRQEGALESKSEEIVLAMDQLDAGNLATADKALAKIGSDDSVGAIAVAKLSRAGIALEQGRREDAVALYAELARDSKTPKPYRDLATIREVSLNYDKLKPAEVEARIKPLAIPGTPFFGSAGELLGAAYLDQGKQELAGPLFAQIARDENVPQSLRSRSRQLAGLMGIDAIVDVDKTLDQLRAQGEGTE